MPEHHGKARAMRDLGARRTFRGARGLTCTASWAARAAPCRRAWARPPKKTGTRRAAGSR